MPSLLAEEIKKFSLFETQIFVETGTYYGETTENVKSMFEKIYTMELKEEFANAAALKFQNDKHITIVQGDSGENMSKICSIIDKPTFFWLDGHWSGGNTARGEKDVPLLEELKAINDLCNQWCIIAIDDARLFGTKSNEDWSNITRENILKIVEKRVFDCRFFPSTLFSEDRMVITLSSPYSSPPPLQVLIYLAGGLGNQLFQIANGIAYCKRYGYQLKITDKTDSKRKTYWDSFLKNVKEFTISNCNNYSQGIDSSFAYTEPFFHYAAIPPLKRFFSGYFQSKKYFEDFKETVQELLSPPMEIQQSVNIKYAEYLYLKSTTNFVVVHVRRTDYYENDHKIGFHVTTNENYYKKAMKTIKDILSPPMSTSTTKTCNLKFLIFSDDIEWCKKQEDDLFPKDECIFIDEPDECLALWFMSRFENYILANSSFSWWSTFFSENAKNVIVPEKWFGNLGPSDYQDIYEPEWIKIKTKEEKEIMKSLKISF